MHPAIECHNLKTAYSPSLQRPILNGISCQIDHGEFVALLGLNGAGKSTLLRSLVGLVPLEQGSININGVPINPRTLTQIRRDIGMLFQGGGLIPQLPAIDNVLCGKLGTRTTWQTLFGFPKRDRRQALEILEQLGLRGQADQKTSLLSGGQQQQLAIARALMGQPQLLLLDEPTEGIQPSIILEIEAAVRRIVATTGISVLLVEQHLHFVRQADYYYAMQKGGIVASGSTHELSQEVIQRFLAV